MFDTLQRCSRLDFLVTPSLGDAKKVFVLVLKVCKIGAHGAPEFEKMCLQPISDVYEGAPRNRWQVAI